MRESIRSWREFTDSLLERFRISREVDFYHQFFELIHEGIVMDYRQMFEYPSSRLGRLSETVFEENFMKGLKPEIRVVVRLLRPRGLEEAMELAKMVEDNNSLERNNKGSSLGASYRITTTFFAPKVQPVPIQREVPKDRGLREQLG
ncbi:hypothetical protein KFK09_014922 [Dendrobium nobile]|uniref:Retrotransposon gag domain-containing protein n=1 Tax=Dendrobium nobile TaxID=94219 RepID=A0A8T3B4P4_DENNO|nr:hypothetical protein KFK09_014922 [Dendrobium nobile]